MGERDDRLPTAMLAEWLRTLADSQDRQAHHDADLLRQAADRLEELTAALRPFADIYAKGSHDPSDPADCLRLLEQAKRATELLGEGPTP